MNCEIHPDVELMPHIFTDLGIVQHHSCIIEERLTPRIVYWLYDCPICTQWHWGKVYEEYGTYFGYWDEVQSSLDNLFYVFCLEMLCGNLDKT